MNGTTKSKFTLDDVVNSFPNFYEYMFEQTGLPMPSEAQLEIAGYLGSDSKDKMLLALRGLG